MTQANVLSALGSPGVSTGFKNRIINGDMRIDQRNAGAAVTLTTGSSGVNYVLDRFAGNVTGTGGSFTIQRDTLAPPGFTNSLKVTVTGIKTPLDTNNQHLILQRIEGFNVADFGFGTSDAKSVTVSFWSRSSVTGVFGGSLRGGSNTPSYPFLYTINAANTWEYKTITIPGSTTGTWNRDNTTGMILTFSLGTGTERSAAAGQWYDNNYSSANDATNLMATNGATFYITGVQLEKGSTATSFDYRPYGTELQLCQRYCQFNSPASGKASTSGGVGAFYIPLVVSMRSAPSVTLLTGTNKVDQIYTSQRTVTSVQNTFGNDTAGTGIGAELVTTSLSANAQCALFGGALILSAEL